MITKDTLKRLEFNKVLQYIAVNARSDSTVSLINNIAPLQSSEIITRIHKQIEEIRALLRQRISLRISRFSDIRPLLEQVKPEGAILSPFGLLDFIPVLASLTELERQLSPRDDIVNLRFLEPFPANFSDILEPLSATVDDEGKILDTASRELAEIRKAKRTLAARVRKKLEEIVRKHETAIFLQDDFITIRSGRWVIPVRMDSKGMVPGVVHDVSSSGETAFIEPIEIIPFVNELENLSAEEKAEEIRILRQISGWIREDANHISACFRTLLELDRLDCLARFAERFSLSVPELNGNGYIRLLSARHPLLLTIRAETPDAAPVQPLDLEMRESSKVLVISGPNAGGKTIALKTVGLITAMALSGIPVPASPSSSIPMLDSILVDIGDDQSIEQSLSTFSAHVSIISSILKDAGSKSLVLLDELGTGTEPLQGAAIGSAVLQELSRCGAIVLATTHLTEIVGFVQQSQGMQNAGMEFDSVTWTPLYRMVMGEPGQSHALETAKRYGLPESVLKTAYDLLGSTGNAFAGIIEELRQKRNTLADELATQLAERERLQKWSEELQNQEGRLSELRQETIERARQDARETITTARRELNQLIEQFKKDRRAETAARFRDKAEELEIRFTPKDDQTPDSASLKPGMQVHIRSLEREATIITVDLARQKVRVRAGSIELEVPVNGILPKQEKTKEIKWERKPKPSFSSNSDDSCSIYSSEINLIGKRVDEALALLEGFIDQAILSGTAEIRIIHGIGTGALQRAVREFLERTPQISSSRPGELYEGRDGATIARLS